MHQSEDIEKVASVQHGIWAHWMKYLFSMCVENVDGSMTIPTDKVVRWRRQVGTDYTDLSELEQVSDRDQAVKVLGVIREYKVVCICGSTRFLEAEREAYFNETLAGNIVQSHAGRRVAGKQTGGVLDQMHFRKIEMSDEILVLNVGGYIGDSTSNEIEYAKSLGKTIRYLVPLEACRED